MPEITTDDSGKRSKKNIAYLIFIFFLVIFFIIGYLSRQSSQPHEFKQTVLQQPQETSKAIIYNKSDPASIYFQKEYFNDTYIVVEKNSPFRSILLTIDRTEKLRGFNQRTQILYFDGETWDKMDTSEVTTNNDISRNTLLNELTNSYENSGSMSAQLTIHKERIAFTSDQLRNEVALKTNGEGGQFIYQGTGTLLANNQLIPAYIFHSREFAFDAAKVAYVTDPENAMKDRTVFWDKEGSFYFSEKIQNGILSESNKEFSVGVKIDSHSLVFRTDSLKSTLSTSKDKKSLKTLFGNDINDLLQLPMQPKVQMGTLSSVDGEITTGLGKIIKREGRGVTGVGLSTTF